MARHVNDADYRQCLWLNKVPGNNPAATNLTSNHRLARWAETVVNSGRYTSACSVFGRFCGISEQSYTVVNAEQPAGRLQSCRQPQALTIGCIAHSSHNGECGVGGGSLIRAITAAVDRRGYRQARLVTGAGFTFFYWAGKGSFITWRETSPGAVSADSPCQI